MSNDAAQQIFIDSLNTYEYDESLKTFNLFHIYQREYTGDAGFADSCFFDLVGYNFEQKKRSKFERRDGLRLEAQPDIIRIYADGSTLVRFENLVTVDPWQEAVIRYA